MMTYYQLTSTDGNETPLAYYRMDGNVAEFWNGSAWEPSATLMDRIHEGDPMLDEIGHDPTVGKSQHSNGNSKTGDSIDLDSVLKGDDMGDDNLNPVDEVPEWVIDLAKGGPGSGPRPGHPFRGNRWTHTSTKQAIRHDLTPEEKNMSASENLDRANHHILAGMQAFHAGQHNVAGQHFDEAAKHAALAARKGVGPTYHEADKLYGLAHLAGVSSHQSSFAMGHLAKAIRSGADAHSISNLAQVADLSQRVAMGHAQDAMNKMSDINAMRLSQAVQGAGNNAQQAAG